MKCNLYGKNIINLDINEKVLKERNKHLSNNIYKFFKTGNKKYIKKLIVVLPSTNKDLNSLYKVERKERKNIGVDSLKSILDEENINLYRRLNIINEGLATYFVMKKINCGFEVEDSKKLDRVLNIYCDRLEKDKSFIKTK